MLLPIPPFLYSAIAPEQQEATGIPSIDNFTKQPISLILSSVVATRPMRYRSIGIALAIASAFLIGTGVVAKKVGSLQALKNTGGQAGVGFSYLTDWVWWVGSLGEIVGEICNVVALSFIDAILVVPIGGLSIVIAVIVAAIWLHEIPSPLDVLSCIMVIAGAAMVACGTPTMSEGVLTLDFMSSHLANPCFLSYVCTITIFCAGLMYWAGPRWGATNILVYLSAVAWSAGIVVIFLGGIGGAIITYFSGLPQGCLWLLPVLVALSLVGLGVQVVYINKSIVLFDLAYVMPILYVYFNATTFIASILFFQGGTWTKRCINVFAMGYAITISGTALLVYSRWAKSKRDYVLIGRWSANREAYAESSSLLSVSEDRRRYGAIRGNEIRRQHNAQSPRLGRVL